MTLQTLLLDRGLDTAIIVDDGYDSVPLAQDMAIYEDAWSNFFADIGEDRQTLVEVYPDFEKTTGPNLQRSDEFVATVWGAKDRIRPELWSSLFGAYDQTKSSDRTFLTNLENALQALGVKSIASGRTIPPGGKDAKIIFADLFMGMAQEASNIELAIERLRQLLKDRDEDPPIVVLMSRSPLLEDKKSDVRDKAKLLGALFRVHRKADLLTGGTLERTLQRLAMHRPDAVRVARFVYSWEKGLSDASERFLLGIRRLDLSDYAQIRGVLLNFEGQPLGSYLMDVFDRVLQHEIEGDEPTIAAAEELNKIEPNAYPAPNISGTADLQDLVYRTIWQNPRRLRVKATEANIPVSFGDVLIRTSEPEKNPEAPTNDAPDALIVLTPACDLVREGGVKRILLVTGTLSDLTAQAWSYEDEFIKTPIAVLPNQNGSSRVWVKWNSKDIRTMLPAEISSLIGDAGGYCVALRLRESNALELQQRILTSLGRVGLIAPMPATFPVEVEAYSFGIDQKPARLSLPVVESEGGVCYTGRGKDGKENCRLVLTEKAIDEIVGVISGLDPAAVDQRATGTLNKLKGLNSLAADLQLGLRVPPSRKSTFIELRSSIVGDDGQTSEQTIGMIARNPQEIKVTSKHSGFILVLRDVETPQDVEEPIQAEPAVEQSGVVASKGAE